MAQLTGLRALVTGGASGLGAAIAAAFTAEGAAVVVLDMADKAPGNLPGGTGYVRADVTDDAAVRAAVDAAAARLGGLDLLVNNAGIGAQGSVADSTDEEWQRVLDVNVIGTARVSRAAWPYLRESSSGGRDQHGLDRGHRRAARPGRLLGQQGRGRRADPGHGGRRDG